jgi:PAS domain S-box-containing protein
MNLKKLHILADRRFLILVIILIVSNIIITGISISILYQKSVSIIGFSLEDIVIRQKSLVTTLNEEGHTDEEIIDFIKHLRAKHYSIGDMGEFVIATQKSDSALFLLSGRGKFSIPLNLKNSNAFPMKLALQHHTGLVKAQDYQGIQVLAAYTYVPSLNWGIVAKMPISEINIPYYQVFYISIIVFVILMIISVFFFIKTAIPLFNTVIDNEQKFRLAIERSPYPIVIHANDGSVLNISKGWENITGYTIEDIPTISRLTQLAYEKDNGKVYQYIKTLYNRVESTDDGEFMITCKNGDKRIWDFSSSVLGKLNDGRIAVMSIAKDVTERNKAQEIIQETEAKFSAVFYNSPVAYNLYGLNGKHIDVNPAFCGITGFSKDEIIGKTSNELKLISNSEILRLKEHIKEKDGSFDNFELDIINKYGATVPILLTRKIINFNNNPVYLGTAIDISQLRVARQSLVEKNTEIESQNEEYRQINEELQLIKEKAEESEKHFRDIIENSQAGYFFIDRDGIYQNVNAAWLNLYKLTGFDKIVGKHFSEMFPSDQKITAEELLEGIKRSDPACINGEFRRICSDSSIGYHSFTARPVYSKRKFLGIEGFIIDTTKQKAVEFELNNSREIIERNEKKYRSLFETMQEGVYLHEMIYDESGKAINYRIIDVNPSAEKYLEIRKDDALGKLATELYGTPEAPFIDIYARVSETCEPQSFEQYFEPMHKHFFISVYAPRKGEFATAFLDISPLKKFEQELIVAKEKAEESDRLKTAFLQNMSHEIRTPMNAIMGFSELLVKNYNNKEKLEHFSQIINQRCNDLLDIINDILDIAKIESNQLPVNIEICYLDQLFSDISIFFNEYQERMNKKDIVFEMLSKCGNGFTINTDKTKLKQIFINLITNAFKFTENGKISCGCFFNENGQLIFYVSDTGMGIPKDKFDFIFERFSQLPKSKQTFTSGTGLGLSIVKGLLALLGGSIWLESEIYKGSTFYFTLNLNNIPVSIKEMDKSVKSDNEIDFTSKSVLVVEDDPFNSDLIEEMLSPTGLKLYFSETGSDAIQKSLELLPDLILMDIGLPDMPGYEAIIKILEKNPTMKIVAQTAYASADDRIKALQSGCVDYISKPIKSQKLQTIVVKYI